MQLMLVNPRKRGKNKMATRKRRTAAQKRATKKLVAFNKSRRRVKRNPAKRKTVARKRRALPTVRKVRRVSTTARKSPVRRRKYKRNPANRSAKMTLKNMVNTQLKPAAIGASGALVLDVGYGYLGGYIPAMLNTGMVRHATKGVVAIAIGMIASNFVKNATVNTMVQGAMTVTMHDALKEAMQTYAPNIPLDGCEMSYYSASPIANDMGYFEPNAGDAYADTNLGYFQSEVGDGYANAGASEVFDTSNI